MNSTRCKLCRKSSIRLERKDRKHIIDKHFHLKNVDGISSFYRDISLRMVFETFKAKLRDGILEEGDYHPSRNMIYYCPFDFVVGSSPTRRGRHRTRYVRVACTRSICPYCDHNVIKVKTIFPDGQRKPISHWERNLWSENPRLRQKYMKNDLLLLVVMRWKSSQNEYN